MKIPTWYLYVTFYLGLKVRSTAQTIMTSPKRGEIQRCFDDPPIGCFSLGYPYITIPFLPFSPDYLNIHYQHVTNRDEVIFHWRDADDVIERRFRAEQKTIMIIHGFTENGTKPWVQNLAREVIRSSGDANVVILDWMRGAGVQLYEQAVANARVVAAIAELFLKKLLSSGAKPASFHIIGNSIGAHIAGDIASRIPGTGRVTGLDPSRWSYSVFPPEARLDPTDAMIVDVTHTDGSKRLSSSGIMVPLGTADFYINGGKNQPGCKDTLLEAILKILRIKMKTKCSHSRARILFIESINTCHISAGKCSNLDDIENRRCQGCAGQSCVTFGYHIDGNTTGLYAFQTGSSSPFC